MKQRIDKVVSGEIILRFEARDEGKRFLITLEQYSGKNTLAQLGFYWASVVDGATKQCESFRGWTKDELHDWLKGECNKRELVNGRTGEISFIASTTTTLSKYDYAAYIDRCIVRLAMEGYAVELPGEYYDRLGKERESETKEGVV